MKKIFVIIFIVLLLTGCGDISDEEKPIREQYENQAKVDAANYIKDKYGIDAKVVKTKALTQGDNFNVKMHLNGEVNVTMKAKNKKFDVIVSINNAYTQTRDNYQKDLIASDFYKKLVEMFGEEPVYYKASTTGFYSLYYNGSNIECFMPMFTAEFINNSNFNYNTQSILQEMIYKSTGLENGRINIYNYKNEDSFNVAKDFRNKVYIGNPNIIYLREYYTYNDRIYYYKTDVKENDITLIRQNLFEERVYSIDNYEKKEIPVSELEFLNKYDLYRNDRDYTFIINSITLDGEYLNKGFIHIYAKKDLLKKYDTIIAHLFCEIGDEYFMTIDMKDMGKYYYASLSPLINEKCSTETLVIKGKKKA